MIPDAERAALLAIARRAVADAVGAASPPVPAIGLPQQEAAVFVSLHSGEHLRGCIGHLEADRPLADVVASCAVSAARDDPRFRAVTTAEVPDLHIEISVLGLMEPVRTLDDIEVGRHGLLVETDHRRGLLLPQVAVEWEWDAATFVAQTCRKAGLPDDAWAQGSARLFRFEAEVFSETKDV